MVMKKSKNYVFYDITFSENQNALNDITSAIDSKSDRKQQIGDRCAIAHRTKHKIICTSYTITEE